MAGLMEPALYVEDTDEDFDPNIPPTSGIEYIKRVQQEAQNCPQVVVADLDTRAFLQKQTVRISSSTGCVPAPKGYAPTLEWQRQQSADFSELRQNVSRYKSRSQKKEKIKLPYSGDENGWFKFCFGNKLLRKGEEADDVEDSEFSSGNLPYLSVITAMSQPCVLKLLDYHINWFSQYGFSYEQGCWLFALLAILEKPLSPETCSSLRILARQCANLRATLETNDHPHLLHLNLMICLVARYFDQGDLADNVEE